MADFKDVSQTIGRPAWDIVRILILQRWNDLIEAVEAYGKEVYDNRAGNLCLIRARLNSLHLSIQAMIINRWGEERYEAFIKEMDAGDEQNIMKCIGALNKELYDIKLTRLDLHKTYDSTDTELENELNNL